MSFSKIKGATSNATGLVSKVNGFEKGTHTKYIRMLGVDVEFNVTEKHVKFTTASKIAIVKAYQSQVVEQKEFYRIITKFCGVANIQSQLSSWNTKYNVDGKLPKTSKPSQPSLPMEKPADISDFEFALDGDKSVGLKQTVKDSPVEMPNTSASKPKSAPKSAPKSQVDSAPVMQTKDELKVIIDDLNVQQKKYEDTTAKIAQRLTTIKTKREAYTSILSVTK